MRKETIEYDSPVDALVALSKRLNTYENENRMSSEEFYDRFSKGESGDAEDFVEWANDYRHYLAIRREIEAHLQDVA